MLKFLKLLTKATTCIEFYVQQLLLKIKREMGGF